MSIVWLCSFVIFYWFFRWWLVSYCSAVGYTPATSASALLDTVRPLLHDCWWIADFVQVDLYLALPNPSWPFLLAANSSTPRSIYSSLRRSIGRNHFSSEAVLSKWLTRYVFKTISGSFSGLEFIDVIFIEGDCTGIYMEERLEARAFGVPAAKCVLHGGGEDAAGGAKGWSPYMIAIVPI